MSVKLRAKRYLDLETFVPRYITVETYPACGEPSAGGIRVRPLTLKGFDPEVRVQCSTKMRQQYSIGTRFHLFLRTRDAKDGTLCLYGRHDDPYEVVIA